jgi:hypothetical protein
MGDVFDSLPAAPRKRRNRRPPSSQAFRARRLYGPDVHWVKGPIPFPLLGQAYRLHRAAIPVLLAIKRAVEIQIWRDPRNLNREIAVTSALVKQIGITSDTRVKAIRALEAAGLVTVTWSTRRAPRVRLADGLFDEGKITVRTP